MKTLMSFNEFELGLSFLEFDKDLGFLDNVFINGAESSPHLINQLNDLLYNEEGDWIGPTKLSQPTKDWDIFISCGFIP